MQCPVARLLPRPLILFSLLLCAALALLERANASVVFIPMGTSDTVEVAVGDWFVLQALETHTNGSLQWFKDGEPIAGQTGPEFQSIVASVTNAADYFFTQSQEEQVVYTSPTVRIIFVPLLFRDQPEDMTAHQGQGAWFSASVLSNAPSSLQWFFNSAPLENETNETIWLSNLRLTNAGSYYVVASSMFGVATSRIATLTVHEAFIAGGSETAYEGGPLVLSVDGRFEHGTEFQWFRDGRRIAGQSLQTLVLVDVDPRAAGTYTVHIVEPGGTGATAPVRVDVVSGGPIFLNSGYDLAVLEGDFVSLAARAVGARRLRYSWRINGDPARVRTGSSLLLARVTTNHTGLYELSASGRTPGEAVTQFNLSVRPASVLDGWHWRLPQPQGARLNAVTWGKGRYVAVGHGGNVAVSRDGSIWQAASVPTRGELEGVTFGNGWFVAWTWQGLIVRSRDGIEWAPCEPIPGDQLASVAFRGGRFVASGTSGSLLHLSTDGSKWRTHAAPLHYAYITSAGSRFFASGYSGYVTADREIYSSANGVHWKLGELRNPAGSYFDIPVRMASDGSSYAGVSRTGDIVASVDGIIWDVVASGVIADSSDIAARAGQYVITVQHQPRGLVLVSSDHARSWTPVDTGSPHELEAIVYADGKYVAVGEAGTIVTSEDGLNWSVRVDNETDLFGVAKGLNQLVSVGHDGAILTSVDGEAWARRNAPTTQDLHDVQYANGLYVAVGRGGTILTSSNAIDWDGTAVVGTSYWKRVLFAENTWIAVGESNACAISTNGIQWSASNVGTVSTDHEGVACGNDTWVIVGGYVGSSEVGPVGTIFTSTNGITWQRRSVSANERLRDVTFGDGRFVAVGNDGLVLVSSNGVQWTKLNIGGDNLRRVIFAGGRFIAVGNNGGCRSSATPEVAASWIKHRVPSNKNVHSIVEAADGSFIAVGNNGMVLQTR